MIFKAFITVLLFSYTALMATDDGEVSKEVVVSSSKRLKLGHEDEAEPVKNGHITELDLSDERELRNIDFIIHFPALQRLSIRFSPRLSDSYHPVSCLENLTHLTLKGIRLTTLVHLESLKFLTDLDLSHNLIKSIRGIEKLPLKKLNLDGNNQLENLDQLSQLTTLRRLDLSHIFMETTFDDDPDLKKLSPCLELLLPLTRLRTLSLSGNDYLTGIAILNRLPRLRRLDISYSDKITDLDKLSTFPSLKRIIAVNLPDLPGLSSDIKVTY